jgi:hypothetical protein
MRRWCSRISRLALLITGFTMPATACACCTLMPPRTFSFPFLLLRMSMSTCVCRSSSRQMRTLSLAVSDIWSTVSYTYLSERGG